MEEDYHLSLLRNPEDSDAYDNALFKNMERRSKLRNKIQEEMKNGTNIEGR